ncbi:MAG: hypothetical protein WED10_04135 [Brumimicrobium sp.]
MKNNALLLTCLLLLLVGITGCKDKTFKKHKVYSPIYTSYEDFRKHSTFKSPQSITSQGNIYIKDQYIFITEPEKGIHFIDNSSPVSPQQIGFLELIGCTGLEIRGDRLYANSYIDLVVFDISSIQQPVELNRVKDAFPEALPKFEDDYPLNVIDKSEGVVTGWKLETIKEEVEYSGSHWLNCPNCEDVTNTFSSTNSNQGQNQGISGSITKFTLINDYLYVMDQFSLKPFDISIPNNPELHEGVTVTREVETLFAYNDHIFMGTTTGMLIYNTSTPSQPQHVSTVNHFTACDPVVVKDNYAYVTVRSGTGCGGAINQLDIINISDYNNPFTESSYSMTNPHGLGIDNNLLFICDGNAGLKVFDATDPIESGNNLIHTFDDIAAIDIIPNNEVAIVIGENAVKQYDYSNPEEFILLSTIQIVQ